MEFVLLTFHEKLLIMEAKSGKRGRVSLELSARCSQKRVSPVSLSCWAAQSERLCEAGALSRGRPVVWPGRRSHVRPHVAGSAFRSV